MCIPLRCGYRSSSRGLLPRLLSERKAKTTHHVIESWHIIRRLFSWQCNIHSFIQQLLSDLWGSRREASHWLICRYTHLYHSIFLISAISSNFHYWWTANAEMAAGLLNPHSHRIVRLAAIGSRCDRWAMFATISSSGRITSSISTRGRAITDDSDWRISMARAIVGNRATSGSDHRLLYDQSWRPVTDDTINRSLHPATDRTSNCGILWPIVRALMASSDRAYDQSWHPMTDGTINIGVQR